MFDQLVLQEPPPEDDSDILWFLAPVGATLDENGVWSYATMLERVEDRGPCPETLTVVAAIETDDLARMTDHERVSYLKVMAAHVAWLEARTLEAVASVANAASAPVNDPLGLLTDVDADEVGAALKLSPGTAHRRVACAQALAGRLPVTRTALEAGQITAQHAAAATEATADLSREDCARVEARVFPRATTQTLAAFKRSLTRAVAWVCPGGFTVKHQAAAARRSISMYDLQDGMAAVHVEMPAPDAQMLWKALDVRARADEAGRDAGLSLDARRVDALAELMAAALADPSMPLAHGKPVTVGVVVELPTLLGLRDGPAELLGYGPIPADLARRLAKDVPWRRMVTEPVTGHLLDLGRTTYTPSQELSEFVLARTPHCVFPGCHAPAHINEIDHSRAWSQGGETSSDNLRPLSKHHHVVKTHHGWAYVVNADGSVTWTSPSGHIYTVPQEPLLE